jgi:hypothetical protein
MAVFNFYVFSVVRERILAKIMGALTAKWKEFGNDFSG